VDDPNDGTASAGSRQHPEIAVGSAPHRTLETLAAQDTHWVAINAAGGDELVRHWPDGTVDTVFVLSPDTTYGRRSDPRGREHWAVHGTLSWPPSPSSPHRANRRKRHDDTPISPPRRADPEMSPSNHGRQPVG
jgi:hypothetical protein